MKKILVCMALTAMFMFTACNGNEKTKNKVDLKITNSASATASAVTATPSAVATATPDMSAEYIFPDSDKRQLEDKEIAALSKKEKRLARNEIYARHGYIFDDFDLSEYFGQKSWYVPRVEAKNFDQTVLNEVEKANIKKILDSESGKTELKRWAGTYKTKTDSIGCYNYVKLTINKKKLDFECGSYNDDNGGRLDYTGEVKIIDTNTAKFVEDYMKGTLQLSKDGKRLTLDAVNCLVDYVDEKLTETYTKK